MAPTHVVRFRPTRARVRATVLAAGLLALGPAARADADAGPEDFASLTLEELGKIQVTTVSRKAERLADTPASVYVISGADIRRSGATSLPEALRLAPNLEVARVDARNYAVTARGFASPFENKLLVLIDGRTVYSPLFSGVFWDAQDVVLADIDRIEVISGPGAAVWGANAVNGVINIITRPAADTVGGLAVLGGAAGARDATLRYGGGERSLAWRAYGKHASADDTTRADGQPTVTGWRRDQAGFRIDADGAFGSATVQGDAYRGRLRQLGTAEIAIGGANLLGRLTHPLAGGELRLQAYLDHTERDQPRAFRERLDTVDVELQHSVRLSPAQLLIWGGGQRVARDRVVNGPVFAFLPGARQLTWTNLFVQDEFALRPDLRLNAGLKLEHNSYTGLEQLPTLSLAWTVQPEHLLWASVARAVRVPSRIDRDLYAPSVPRVVDGVPQYGYAGGPAFAAEVVRAWQLGYRGLPHPGLRYAFTAFYDDFARLRTLEPNPSGPGRVFLNRAHGHGYGLEFNGSWDVRPDWRLSLGHTVQHLDVALDPDSRDASGATGLASDDPRAWSQLRSAWDVSDRLEADLTLRHVGALPKSQVPAYTALDARLGWAPVPALELSLLLENLGADRHAEWGAAPGRSAYPRRLAARLAWRF